MKRSCLTVLLRPGCAKKPSASKSNPMLRKSQQERVRCLERSVAQRGAGGGGVGRFGFLPLNPKSSSTFLFFRGVGLSGCLSDVQAT